VTPTAELLVPRAASDAPAPFPPVTDFHQSLPRLLCLRRLGVETRLAVALRGGMVAATAAFERRDGRWFLWKGPAGGEPDPEVLAALLRAADGLRPATLILDPAWDHPAVLREAGYAPAAAFTTLLVPAGGGPGAILSRLRSAARRGVRRAEAAGVCFSRDPGHLPAFYEVYGEGMAAAGSPDVASPAELELLLGLSGVHLFTALLDGRVIAGSVCFRHRDALEARWVATDAAHRGKAPLHFVHFHTLTWAGTQGVRCLDLSGLATGEMDPKLANINRFKESFGGVPYAYPTYTRG
jgi:hypothetical protein